MFVTNLRQRKFKSVCLGQFYRRVLHKCLHASLYNKLISMSVWCLIIIMNEKFAHFWLAQLECIFHVTWVQNYKGKLQKVHAVLTFCNALFIWIVHILLFLLLINIISCVIGVIRMNKFFKDYKLHFLCRLMQYCSISNICFC